MERTKWTDRKFSFDFPEGWMANILERLHGTWHRLVGVTWGVPDERLVWKPGNQWSIQEHIGHLADLEELHAGRIDDFVSGKDTLRAADMSNAKTENAQHNKNNLDVLLDDFRNKRIVLINKLEKLDDKTQHLRLLHPRLQTLMRPVDVAFFTAEHDDHHLASIREMIRTHLH